MPSRQFILLMKEKIFGGLVIASLLIPTFSFAQTNSAASAVTEIATSVTYTSAHLSGKVNTGGAIGTVWFDYGTSQSLGKSTPRQGIGNGSSVPVWDFIFNLQMSSTYYYRVALQTTQGISYGQIMNFTTRSASGGPVSQPQTYYQPPTYAQGSYNYNQGSYNYNYAQGSYQSQTYPSRGDYGPNAEAQALAAYKAQISGVRQPLQTYQQPSTYQPTSNKPTVVTSAAMNIKSDGAVVRGVMNPQGYAGKAWFEYGLSNQLGSATGEKEFSTSSIQSSIAEEIGALQPNTTYYYRPVVATIVGTSYGGIGTFRTLRESVVASTTPSGVGSAEPTSTPTSSVAQPNPPVEQPAVVPTSPILVTTAFQSGAAQGVSFNQISPKPGDEFKYLISYRNTSTSTIKNAALLIVLPRSVSYIAAEPRPVTVSENIVTIPLSEIRGGGEGRAIVAMKLDQSASGEKLDFAAVAVELAGNQAPLLQSRIAIDSKETSSSYTPLASLMNTLGRIPRNLLLFIVVLAIVGIMLAGRLLGRDERKVEPSLTKTEKVEIQREVEKQVEREVEAQVEAEEEALKEKAKRVSKTIQEEIRKELGLVKEGL